MIHQTIDELATLFGQGNQFSGFIRLRRIVNSRGKEMLFVDFNTAFVRGRDRCPSIAQGPRT